ncbi:MFS transporter [Sedimentibacter hydroxybenzoicus DSM 7310]|uniref:MFS transporter n=2 Tax=Sedimentibacter TaxID=190972 RepID=A0A974BHX4_SEDHY|nr:MFS transporter [Sedimentibacter hydroxybenzoicus]NYB73231.1 MFS transporter [Sedimentibacter hydroxybenzoicus DSM 7310]
MKNLNKKNNNNLVLLLLGRGVSDMGASIQMIVMPLYIIDIGGSAATVGLYSFLSLATVFVYPMAGVLGDRLNRKTIMVSTDFASAGVVLMLSACAYYKLISLPILLIAQVLIATLNGIFDPATKGMVPQIVEHSQLTKANSVISALRTTSVLLGSAIGSMLYVNLGVTVLFLLNGISFFLSGCSEMFISYQHIRSNNDGKSLGMLSDLMDGIRFILQNKIIGKLCVYFLITYALVQPIFNVVLPVFFRSSLSYSDVQYGYLQMFVITGALLGSILVGVLFGKGHQVKKSLFTGCTLMVIVLSLLTTLIFPFFISLFGNNTTAYFLLLSGALCLLSAVLMLIHIPVQTYIQMSTPNEYMSRIFSIVGMITKGGMPLGALLYGVILEKVAVHWTMLFTTLLTMLISAFFLISVSKMQVK